MARRYFGTDGVRGIAGELVTADLVERLGRAAVLWSGAERVLIGRDTRGSGVELEGGGGDRGRLGRSDRRAGRDPSERRGRARRARPRDRDHGVAQPARVQRRQVLPGRGPEAHRRGRGGDREPARRAAGRAARQDRARPGRRRGLRRLRPRALRLRPDRPRARASTARTGPTRISARKRSNGSEPACTRSAALRTGRTSTPAAAPPTRRSWSARWSREAPRSASPSTATATASSRSTSAARSSTATASSRSSRSTWASSSSPSRR